MPTWVYLLLAPVVLVAVLAIPGVAEAVGRAARVVSPPTAPPPARPFDPRVAAARAEYLDLVRRTRELERRNRRRRTAR